MKQGASTGRWPVATFKSLALLLIFAAAPSGLLQAQVSTTCIPVMTTGCVEDDIIDSFVLNGVATTGNAGCNNTSTAYTLFTSPVRTLMVGQTYTWSVTHDLFLTQKFAIWIDLNSDGNYDAAEQLVATAASAASHNGSITIPMTATTGTNIAMRTRCKWGSATWGTGNNEACQSYQYGETEDYKLVLIPCPAPSLTITPASASVCPGNTVAFTASGATNYTWTGGISNGVAFTPTASAVYTVSGTFTSGCISTATAELLYNPPITINASTTNICSGSSVTLTANGGSGLTWSTSQTGSIIVVSPGSTTTYSVSGTTPQGCNATGTIAVTVATGPPALTFTNTSAATGSGICPSKTVALTGGGADTYTWSAGVQNGVAFSPAGSGTYVLTGANVCGTSTVATTVSVHPLPNITASRSSASICSTQSVVVTGGGGVSYTWLPVNITNGQPFYPFFTQTYTVTGTSVYGCTNTAQTTITVVTTPVIPPVSSHSLICIGNSATLSATGASNYSWTPFTPAVTASSVIVSPTTTTTYSLTKWNANCFKTDSITVIVNQLPTVFAVANPTIVCAGSNATLSAGGGVSYAWAPGNLPSGPTAANIVVSPQVNTVYTVTAFDGTCYNTATVAMATNTNPVISIGVDKTEICTGQQVAFNITGGLQYTVTNNPANSPTISGTQSVVTAVVTLTTPTNYIIQAVNAAGCRSSGQQFIMVHPLPLITITRTPTLVCVGFPSTLNASSAPQSPAHSYNWTHGGNNNVSVVNPIITSVYMVTGTNNITGCVNSQSIGVAVFKPVFTSTPDTAICIKGSINLTASGALSYSWAPNGPNNVPFWTVSPTVTTMFTVSATSQTVGGLKCISAREVSVGIYHQPTVSVTPDRTVQAVCREEPISLMGHGASTYYWPAFNHSGGTVTTFPTKETLYTVIGTDIFGCKDTATFLVKFSNCPGIAEQNSQRLKLNVFPNPSTGDFTLEAGEDMELQLVNGLGQVVKEISLSARNSRRIVVQELAAGMYFITGRHDNRTIKEKIIISR